MQCVSFDFKGVPKAAQDGDNRGLKLPETLTVARRQGMREDVK